MTGRFQVVPAAYVLLLRGDGARTEVLLQLRAGTGYRDGYWAAAAAGHVEQGEDVFAAAVRETREELGVVVDRDDLVAVTAMHRTGGTGLAVDERVDFFLSCRRWSGEPRAAESGKTAGLDWFPLAALPTPTVPHERFVLDALRTGSIVPIVSHGFAAADDAGH
ncbi:NUDIX hydrolase [Pseudonocardia sp. HH130630-07]|uniref:NUDIX hydrolase n=1 Tax=Pseudonocardia sp. HH130630-07 TaxID=1690815 RepID=UPI000814CD8C|nr:NUDIX domain-containing protein [Pseudonocardia sp. HH130630-07]ANY08433.1 DNA mismatch repair protein MutT [Pseudonocardia sp. HH130630-07]